eukprot:TRINITY_DN6177_c0_g1_i2.p2 TRINITY_DN6177_c0_g1~~TRINITY_DN6177_c0_g1_i2.p2  ORF type:complete len:289 (+),score=89.28 TRINITY_DN6177_c0_g1_i2:55-921(+)
MNARMWCGVAAVCALALVGHAHPRVVAIGDLHGDYDKSVEVLREAGVIDAELRWVGGGAVVVQCGDLTDRGDRMNDIIALFEKLKPEAEAAGGEVVTLLGNHEVMNLVGDLRYVHPKTLAEAGGREGHMARYDPVTGDIGKVLMKYPTVVERADTLFVHAGFLLEHAKMGVERVNQGMWDAIAAGRAGERSPLMGSKGPVWVREQVAAAAAGDCASVHAALAGLPSQPKRMVVGHTIQRGGTVGEFCNGAFYAIDIAMSTFIARADYLAYLEIAGGAATVRGRARDEL